MRDINDITVRMAGRSDRLAICALLQQAWHSAGGARWDQLDALEADCAGVVAYRGTQPIGAALFDLRTPPVSRLSAVAVADQEPVGATWGLLWQTAEYHLRTCGHQSAYYIGEAPWLLEILREQEFRQTNTVVSYEKLQDTPLVAGNPSVRVRPLRTTDLDAVAELDAASFPVLWRYPRPMLEAALQPLARLTVAELDRRLVGYQLSTQEGREGQIVRLAVLPQYRRQGIGSRLLADSLDTLRRGRVRRVTLNTQADNLPAQKLYERFGFEATGEELPVFEKALR